MKLYSKTIFTDLTYSQALIYLENDMAITRAEWDGFHFKTNKDEYAILLKTGKILFNPEEIWATDKNDWIVVEPNEALQLNLPISKLRSKKMHKELLELAFNTVESIIKEQVLLNPKRVLNVISLSDDSASESYVKNKQKICKEYNINFELHKPTSKSELFVLLNDLRKSEHNRTIVQWPFDESVWGSRLEVMDMIPKYQDVDGFHWSNLDTVCCKGYEDMLYNPSFSPTAKFVFVLLAVIRGTLGRDFRNLKSEDITVIGQGLTSGLPIATMAEKLGGTVTWLNSKTTYNSMYNAIKEAQIVISCAGVPDIIHGNGHMSYRADSIYINVGMSRHDGQMKGDIDFESINKASGTCFVNPLFGSTGKGTCLCLALNTVL